MSDQTTGYLATECPSCDGTGDIVVTGLPGPNGENPHG